jgi:hypothetical protein
VPWYSSKPEARCVSSYPANSTTSCVHPTHHQQNNNNKQMMPNLPKQTVRLLLPAQVVADAAAVTNATYATLGLAGASFVGTFFVAPRFKDSFKEDIDWRDMYKELVAAGGVASVTPREAFNKSRR